MNVAIIRYLTECSLKRLVRNKYNILVEAFLLCFGLLILLGSSFAQPLLSTPPLYTLFIVVGFLMFLSFNAGAKIGVHFILLKNQGFLQELCSAPASAVEKIIGLVGGTFIVLLIQATVLIAAVPYLTSTPISIMQAIAGYVIVTVTLFSACFFGLFFSSKTESPQLLSISMGLLGATQFGFNGLLLSFKDAPLVALNPFSYVADFFLYATGNAQNYPLTLDVAVACILLIVTGYLAKITMEKTE